VSPVISPRRDALRPNTIRPSATAPLASDFGDGQSGDVAIALDSRAGGTQTDISNGVAYTNAAAGSVADLLSLAREPFTEVAHETDRVAGIALADHDYLDNLFNTLPDKYRALVRQGIYGDFFAFYLCDVVLKLNGRAASPRM
jgi:phospholipid/cholesterol/gamma-HCH transport system substrate-binding protein